MFPFRKGASETGVSDHKIDRKHHDRVWRRADVHINVRPEAKALAPVRPPVELAELAQIAGARAGVWFDKLTRHEQKQQKQQKGRVHQTGVTRDRGSLGLTGYVVLGRRA